MYILSAFILKLPPKLLSQGVGFDNTCCFLHAVPSEPLSVAASPEGMGRTLVVTWAQPTYPNAPSLSYVVTYTATPSGVEMAAMTQDLTSSITGLSPFTNYSIAVQACSEVGCGAQSSEVMALTREEVMALTREEGTVAC